MLTSKNNSVGESTSQGIKRPLEDISAVADESPEAKRIKDSFGSTPNINMQNSRAVQNGVIVEDYSVPDALVGLIIGRGGDQISRLQIESGCKVQLAHDSAGKPERMCTLTGTKDSIMKAKEMLNKIINRGSLPPKDFEHPPNVGGGQSTIELMIPGPKAGLIIGKGGETIKHLQESIGVKMVIVQDSPQTTNHEKPLRISGEPYKCEMAKQMVLDILMEKEEIGVTPHRASFKRPFNDFNNRGNGLVNDEIIVPKPAVGVVIGKGGEMIKRLQQDSGAKIHFDQSKDAELQGSRLCIVNGMPDQVEMALNYITELIQSVLMRDGHQPPPPPPHHAHHPPPPPHHSMGRGRGRGRGRGGSNYNNMERGGPPRQDVEIKYSVPAARCGVIIGKGGENIRAINEKSGAHVELFKGPPPNIHEKLFIIRGSQSQIDHAQLLINEKINGPMAPTGAPPNNHGNVGPPPPHYHGHQPHPQHTNQSSHHFPVTQSYQAPPNGPPPPSQPPQYAPQTHWTSGFQQPYQPPPAAPVSVATVVAPTSIPIAAPAPLPADPTKPASADQSAAQQWAAYYAYYNQPTLSATAAPQAVQPAPIAPVQAVVQQIPAPQAVVAATAPAAATAASGQPPDYSAAWAEYYRSLGMFREAEMVEQQARSAQTAAPQVAQPSYITQTLATPQQPTAAAAPIVASLPQPVATAPTVVASPGQWPGGPYSHAPQPAPTATAYVGYSYPGYPPQ